MTAPSWSPNTRDASPNWSANDPALSATAPTITTTSLAEVAYGAALSVALSATGSAPIAWSVSSGTLPAWASLSSAGVLSGDAATTPGATTFTVQAANSAGSDTQVLTLTVPNEATSDVEFTPGYTLAPAAATLVLARIDVDISLGPAPVVYTLTPTTAALELAGADTVLMIGTAPSPRWRAVTAATPGQWRSVTT